MDQRTELSYRSPSEGTVQCFGCREGLEGQEALLEALSTVFGA